MSLILDALKKLEREKQTTPRGFLVVAPRAWAGSGGGLAFVGGALAVGLVLGALGLTAYGRWMAPDAPPPGSAALAPVPTPAPALAQAPTTPPQAIPRAPSRSSAPAPRTEARAVPEAGDETVPGEESAPPPEEAAPSPTPAPQVPAGPRLQAISRRDGRPVAVIDERLVHEGEEIEGMKILRIGTAEVEIEIAGRRQILRF